MVMGLLSVQTMCCTVEMVLTQSAGSKHPMSVPCPARQDVARVEEVDDNMFHNYLGQIREY